MPKRAKAFMHVVSSRRMAQKTHASCCLGICWTKHTCPCFLGGSPHSACLSSLDSVLLPVVPRRKWSQLNAKSCMSTVAFTVRHSEGHQQATQRHQYTIPTRLMVLPTCLLTNTTMCLLTVLCPGVSCCPQGASVQVFELGGDVVSPQLANNLMKLIAEGAGEEDEQADTELRAQAVRSYLDLLDKPHLSPVLLKVSPAALVYCLPYAFVPTALHTCLW